MLKKNRKRILPLLLAIFTVASFLVYQIKFDKSFVFAADSVEDIEKDIKKQQNDLNKLNQELNSINSSVNSTQAQISRTEAMIKEAVENINKKKKELDLLSSRIDIQKEILKNLLQEFYYSQKEPIIYSILNEEDLSQAFAEADHLLTLNQKVYDTVDDIKQSKEDAEKQKQEIEETREDHEKLLDMKEDQKQDLLAEKAGTQQDINKKEATLGELQAELSKLKSSLSGYLGKAYDAKDVEDAARFASKASGVRKDFIMGMLTVESNLGRFTGGCNAVDSNMSGTRLSLFKDICKALDYNWKTRKVSCPPRSYKGTGGAMGVAQFMSDTWMGYKSSISSKTGHNPPDPWNLTDGVMAMGLKLAKGGATSKSGECNAAKLYLSGTTNSKYNWYCQKVLYWADNYESKLGN